MSRGGSAIFVAIGIFLTRVTGLVRQRVFAHYFGLGVEADAFSAAFRIPNFLQNLLAKARCRRRSFRSTRRSSPAAIAKPIASPARSARCSRSW